MVAFSLIPDREVADVTLLEGAALAAAGIRLVLADLDNTLAPYGVRAPAPSVLRWKEGLEQHGVQLFILSNSRRPTRVSDFAARLGVPFLGRAGKPRPEAYHRVMQAQCVTPNQTLMVGDQLFTDILGAKRAGITAVVVRPMVFGTPFRAIRYGIELPLRALGRRRQT